jgi:hypothetical protein
MLMFFDNQYMPEQLIDPSLSASPFPPPSAPPPVQVTTVNDLDFSSLSLEDGNQNLNGPSMMHINASIIEDMLNQQATAPPKNLPVKFNHLSALVPNAPVVCIVCSLTTFC